MVPDEAGPGTLRLTSSALVQIEFYNYQLEGLFPHWLER